MQHPMPLRQIRAEFDDASIVVYQAYRHGIAEPAIEAQTFVPPFSRTRMTWIKPSFLWMMYRSGWATKEGQERVLRLRLKRSGFEWALEHGCLSSAAKTGVPESAWAQYKAQFPVRVQWDPERDLQLQRLEYRSIQVGLSGEAVVRYVDDWILTVEDATPIARRIQTMVQAGDLAGARAAIPIERAYPAAGSWSRRLKLSSEGRP